MSNLYNAQKSTINNETLISYITGDVEPSITTVPGIGTVGIQKLAEGPDAITNTFQLIGKALSLYKTGMTCQEHRDAFYEYLKSIGVNSHRVDIVRCITEQLDTLFPRMYSKNLETVAEEIGEQSESDSDSSASTSTTETPDSPSQV
ncbi:hypothetical protein WA158_001434 [Blastocystis sp. Blastoise]